MKKCNCCLKIKSLSNFYTKKIRAGGKNYPSSFCKPCDIKRVHVNIKKLRKIIVDYMGGQCVECGYKKCINALEIHHREKKDKKIIFSKARSMSQEVKKELKKCDLLCANCHREVESEEYLRGVEYGYFNW